MQKIREQKSSKFEHHTVSGSDKGHPYTVFILQIQILLCLICTLFRKSHAPCKIYPIFFRVAKAMRFFRAWHPFFSDLPYESEKNGCHALENLRCCCHPEKKDRFYRAPFIFDSGCRLNKGMIQYCIKR